MSEKLQCWKCGAQLADVLLPLPRAELCRACNADLHVCRMCVFYDVRVAKHCREPIAEEVKDKTRANFCDYLVLRPDAFEPRDSAAIGTAQQALDGLFGLAGGSSAASAAPAAADEAWRRLDDLFGKS
ncbi:MAG: hypothetical protein IT495_16565 [Gammaproteobacteria bacterium]|nr:hypothetical protein [Gammaproteobacteria bacterium]